MSRLSFLFNLFRHKKLGTKNKPAIVHVKTLARAKQIISICNENGWHHIVGIEPEKTENISNINQLYGQPIPGSNKMVGRNQLCRCGSGLKYKKCCGV